MGDGALSSLLTPALYSATIILEQGVDNKQQRLLIQEAMMTNQHNAAIGAAAALHRPTLFQRLMNRFAVSGKSDGRPGASGQVMAGKPNDESGPRFPAATGRLIVGCRPYVVWQSH